MRAELRTILTNIKAAARIGHAESLAAALDGLLDLKEVAGNPPLSDAFINRMVLPVGQALTAPRLQLAVIRPLGNAPFAMLRAVCAVALAQHHFDSEKIGANEVAKLGRDPRQDVRLALQLTLASNGLKQPDKLLALVEDWLTDSSPRLQSLAVRLLPTLAVEQPGIALGLLDKQPANSDPELRAALAETVTQLAQSGLTADMFSQMESWSAQPNSYLWVICKALSGSWAAKQPATALDLLERLAAEIGEHKQITNSLQAMMRHGAKTEVETRLQTWQANDNPQLQAASKLK